MARAPGWWPIGAIVTVLVVANVVSNRVLTLGWYVPWSLTVAAVLLWLAVGLDGRSWGELGLARHQWGAGLRWGAALAGSVFVVYLVAAVLPATRELFEDDRVRGWTLAETGMAAFVRVPFGTVVLEEVAFRGVLPAVLAVRISKWRAIGVSAVLFGLWHVLPALGIGDTNPVAQDTVGRLPEWVTVTAAVLATAAVGVFFSWLKERSTSLFTPMALHWATNSFGYVFAYWAWQHR